MCLYNINRRLNMKKDVESGIYEQRRWFRFFKVYPLIAFIVSECVLLIAAVV